MARTMRQIAAACRRMGFGEVVEDGGTRSRGHSTSIRDGIEIDVWGRDRLPASWSMHRAEVCRADKRMAGMDREPNPGRVFVRAVPLAE